MTQRPALSVPPKMAAPSCQIRRPEQQILYLTWNLWHGKLGMQAISEWKESRKQWFSVIYVRRGSVHFEFFSSSLGALASGLFRFHYSLSLSFHNFSPCREGTLFAPFLGANGLPLVQLQTQRYR